jgi:hypothetical protein
MLQGLLLTLLLETPVLSSMRSTPSASCCSFLCCSSCWPAACGSGGSREPISLEAASKAPAARADMPPAAPAVHRMCCHAWALAA